ncbi:serine/threonine-protein kinase [Actinomadura algeriensis]|uniref:non-specific serine/threonine protein kinase n=1 Tax=Actinomadura algeriensis TaxID=1679523 RepID=A0ABR9JV46_9ACTN|nr:serine/threonine-protein kinase [Actinomadura algeriensis]MBE1534425.1 serine/threonine protein kinase [Actinomadura algeriensis]
MTDGPKLEAGAELDGRYRLESVIGRGGMGEVWRAVDRRLRRPVAVKVLPAELADVPGAMERFEREAEATAALQHPGIMVVFDVGRTDAGLAFLVMELLEGEDLRTIMRRNPGGLPVEEAVDFAAQLADALAAAHSRGIVHRDIKPANLFVLPDGRLKLCDFGIAGLADAATRLTQDGGSVGTPLYMAPEQFRGGGADFRSDLYALGCVLHELLTGGPPFRSGSGLPGLLYAHLNEAPPPVGAARPEVPPQLERLVLDLLAKTVDQRPVSAEAVASLLRAADDGAPSGGPPTAPPPPPGFPPPPVTAPLPGYPAHTAATVLPGRPPRGGPPARVLIAAGAAVAGVLVLVTVAAVVLLNTPPDGEAAARTPVATSRSASASPSPTEPPIRKIVYKVTGNAPEVSVTIMHPDGGMSRKTVDPPWTDEYEVTGFTFLSISGMIPGLKGGKVGCSISVDGKVVQKRDSDGQFATVTCQYQQAFTWNGYGGTAPSAG